MAVSFFFIIVYTPSLETCTEADVCGKWTDDGVSAFHAIQRPMFGFTVCWMILACITGNGGEFKTHCCHFKRYQNVTSRISSTGLFNIVFSWSFFVPLAKLSYVGYLVHPILCYFYFYTSPVQVYYTNFNFVRSLLYFDRIL